MNISLVLFRVSLAIFTINQLNAKQTNTSLIKRSKINKTQKKQAGIAKKKQKKSKNTQPILLGKFGAWEAYKQINNYKEIFYMVSYPTKSSGKYKKRGKIFALITHRPYMNSYNVLSINAGYKFHPIAEVTATIESKKGIHSIDLFSDDQNAWCIDDKTDAKAIKLITKIGDNMVVKGVSIRGTETKDIYSLKGSLKAYNAITQATKNNK